MHADVASICRIPIGNSRDDMWAWKHDKSGIFSVRSAYKILCQQRNRPEGELNHRGGLESVGRNYGAFGSRQRSAIFGGE